MAERDSKGNVIPEVGQEWDDNDWRHVGRRIRIDEIDGTYAVCTITRNTDERQAVLDLPGKTAAYQPPDMRGRRTRIALDRLRPNSTGYRYVEIDPGYPAVEGPA